jgi:hypothetical protein
LPRRADKDGGDTKNIRSRATNISSAIRGMGTNSPQAPPPAMTIRLDVTEEAHERTAISDRMLSAA